MEYYGSIIGEKNLYVIAHGDNPYIQDIAGDFNVLEVPRDPNDAHFDKRRWALLSDLASGLTQYHDAVICLDVDEFIVPTAPNLSVQEELARLEPEAPYALPGFELFGDESEEIAQGAGFGPLVSGALFSPFYSKAVIAQKRVAFYPGGHGLYHEAPRLHPNLALFHLKYVSPTELTRRSDIRKQVASEVVMTDADKDTGWQPLKTWRKIDRETQSAYKTFSEAPELDWAEFIAHSKSELERLRIKRGDVHRFMNKKFKPTRSALPEWLKSRF